MPEQLHQFDALSTREGFNRSLRHFKFIMQVIAEFEQSRNLAEILSDRLSDRSIETHQVLPTISAILVDKYKYACKSHNLTENFEAVEAIAAETARWKALDIVLVYFHPELGVVAINPKNLNHWQTVRGIKKNELVTVFAGAFQETTRDRKYKDAIALLIQLLEGKKARTPAAFLKGKYIQRKPAPAAPPAKSAGRRKDEVPAAQPAMPQPALTAPAAGEYVPSPAAVAAPVAVAAAPAPSPAAPAVAASTVTAKRMTPMYGIPVTNELFHNGNVEAWKKIIQSYTTKYPSLEVYVYYEGEKIHDINTLFKWGKVKHGSVIMIAIAGDDFKDIAKLQRYLKQGASHMFEAFLKAPANSILNLF